jgi:hypothetical protein
MLAASVIRVMDDGGSRHPWNIGKRLPDYTAQHPRTQTSSYSPPWELEISPSNNQLHGSQSPLRCNQVMPTCYGTQKFITFWHKSPPLSLILSQLKSFCAFTTCSGTIPMLLRKVGINGVTTQKNIDILSTRRYSPEEHRHLVYTALQPRRPT